MSEQKQDEKVGALWSKSSARGEFFTGNIELSPAMLREVVNNAGKLAVVVFRNDQKTGNQPDWRILRSRPKSDAAPIPSAPVADVTDQDVPF